MRRVAALRRGSFGKKGGEEAGEVEELTKNPSLGSISAEKDRRSGSTRRGGARATLPWRPAMEGRFRRGKLERGLGRCGGGGGQGEEGARGRNRRTAAGVRRSMGGGGDGTSSARLGGGRRERELSEINKNWEMVRGLKNSQPV